MPMRTTGIREIARKCDRFPVELAAELRPAVQAGADLGAAKVREKWGWSSAIPALVTSTARLSSAGGAEVRTKDRGYPHAGEVRAYEGDGISPEPSRHPVYGTDTWVEFMTRPSHGPGIREAAPEIKAMIAAAVHRALT